MRTRLLLLLAGTGALLAGVPAVAAVAPEPLGAAADERRALTLLEEAARAARTTAYSGTQYVAAWSTAGTASTLAEVRSDPATGPVVVPGSSAAGAPEVVPATPALDPRLLPVLAQHYALTVVGLQRCTGRKAAVVEARRADGGVAGRFWVDQQSRLVLRREVYDDAGRTVRSSAFVDVDVQQQASAIAASYTSSEPADVEALRREGWDVPDRLPGDLELFDARLREHAGADVLHLAYTDGLSTVSLFAQRGRLGDRSMQGYREHRTGRSSYWVRGAAPERVVWSGGGRVWTLVGDAPAGGVEATVRALPLDERPSEGFFARLGRGVTRVASWVNPFS